MPFIHSKYLNWDEWLEFPHPDFAHQDGVIAWGGNFSPGVILSAYQQGCFPWSSDEDILLWWNPDPRFVLFPNELHISKSLKRFMKSHPFEITFDNNFEEVIRCCQKQYRPDQNGTWITNSLLEGYCELHRLGFAHSVEVWKSADGGTHLVGGLYGILLGRVFFGESMFSLVSQASKVGFITMMEYLMRVHQIMLVDCQAPTDYLASFGAKCIPRNDFLMSLSEWIIFPGRREPWIRC